VVVFSSIGAGDEQHDIVSSVFIEISIADGWLEFVSVFVYPFL
jgi:hypothetical protein